MVKEALKFTPAITIKILVAWLPIIKGGQLFKKCKTLSQNGVEYRRGDLRAVRCLTGKKYQRVIDKVGFTTASNLALIQYMIDMLISS